MHTNTIDIVVNVMNIVCITVRTLSAPLQHGAADAGVATTIMAPPDTSYTPLNTPWNTAHPHIHTNGGILGILVIRGPPSFLFLPWSRGAYNGSSRTPLFPWQLCTPSLLPPSLGLLRPSLTGPAVPPNKPENSFWLTSATSYPSPAQRRTPWLCLCGTHPHYPLLPILTLHHPTPTCTSHCLILYLSLFARHPST